MRRIIENPVLFLVAISLLIVAGGCGSGEKKLTHEEQRAKAMKIGDPGTRAQKLITIAKSQIIAGSTAGAIETLTLAQKSALDVEAFLNRATILNKIASLQADLEQTSGGMDTLKEVGEISSRIEDPFARSRVTLNMALNYGKLGSKGSAMSSYYLEEACKESVAIEDPSTKMAFQVQVADAFAQLGEKEKAAEVLEELLTSIRADENARTRCDQLANSAMVFHQLGQNDRAKELLEEASTQADQIKTPSSRAHALAELAMKYSKIGDKATAAALLSKAETVSEKISDSGLKEEVVKKIQKYRKR